MSPLPRFWVGRLECEIVGRGLDVKVGVREFELCI